MEQEPRFAEDFAFAESCLAGDAAALAELRSRCQPVLVQRVISNGATQSQAEDVVADILEECIPGEGQRSLLLKFGGRSSLPTWLTSVAVRRWIDSARREKKRKELAPVNDEGSGNDFDALPAEAERGLESDLLQMMRAALQDAFAQCPPEEMLMLRLVYLHGVGQREIAHAWGWHESKVSRALGKAMQEIAGRTLAQIRSIDAGLKLEWQDFLDVCRTTPDLL